MARTKAASKEAPPASPQPTPAQMTPNPAGPQIARRESWVDVPGYPGFRVKLWTNYPHRVLLDLEGGELSRLLAALRVLVLEHNGWRDYDPPAGTGQEYPPASDPDFWTGEQAIPTELAATVIRLARNEPYALPNSLAPTRGSSDSGSVRVIRRG